MPDSTVRQNLWELAVLSLLREQPMHPYEMQKLLRHRHKDKLLTLKRGSLYHAIHRLQQLQLIEPAGTGRAGKRPERTTYRIAPPGRKILKQWIHGMIAEPAPETSEFMAALSFLVHLTPSTAIPALQRRMRWLETNIAEFEHSLETLVARVKRINLIETEYLVAMRRAELEWIRELVSQLRSGQFDWDLRTVLRDARQEEV